MNQLELDLQPAEPSYRLIPLSQGQFAKVDESDYEFLSTFSWRARWSKNTRSFYAEKGSKGESVQMSRVIMGAAQGAFVDHRNHDTLDNQKLNLRPATRSQNQHNRRPNRNRDLPKGVSFRYGRYGARIRIAGKRIDLGWFSTAQEAAATYQRAAIARFGDFACFSS